LDQKPVYRRRRSAPASRSPTCSCSAATAATARRPTSSGPRVL